MTHEGTSRTAASDGEAQGVDPQSESAAIPFVGAAVRGTTGGVA